MIEHSLREQVLASSYILRFGKIVKSIGIAMWMYIAILYPSYGIRSLKFANKLPVGNKFFNVAEVLNGILYLWTQFLLQIRRKFGK